MDQIEQAVIYALGPQVDPTLKAQVNNKKKKTFFFIRVYNHVRFDGRRDD